MTEEAARPPAPPRQRTPRQVAAIAALLLLAGCTTDPTPPTASSTVAVQSPAATQVDTPPPSPGPAPAPAYMPATADAPAQNVPTPVLPEKAKEFSKEGLEAFARHWYATLGYAFETGDPGPMMAISYADCKTCNAMKNTVVPWHSEGRWIVGGQMYVLSADSTFKLMPDNSYQVIALVRQQHVLYYRSDKSLSEDMGVKPSIADIVVAHYSDGQWQAATVEHLQGNEP